MKSKKQCGAHARTTGNPCKAKALPNGRCKLHGGMSSGPTTLDGRRAVGAAAKMRLCNGGLEKLQEGFQKWLDAGGREHLSWLAKRRHARAKWIKMMNSVHASPAGARPGRGVSLLERT